MRNHTTAKFYELVSQQGKNPSVTPGTAPVAVQFLLNNIPTGKEGKFWYYAMAIMLKVVVSIDQPSGEGGSVITADKLWKIIQSVNLQCPILGQLYTHQNTRGGVLGNLIQYFGYGFGRAPIQPLIGATSDTTVTLYYRIPLSYEFLRKPHETAPWGGFLEGGTFEVKMDVNSILDADSDGAVLTTPSNMRAWVELIPAPEAVIHTPSHWREHQTPGNSTKMIIQDLGSPDGLQGIDMSKGVGLAALMYLMNPAGEGLAGSTTADNIVSYDIPWRDQDRVDVPDAPYANLVAMMGGNNRQMPSNTALFGGGGQAGFPYGMLAGTVGDLNDAQSQVFPLVCVGRDAETSKFQTVAGAKESNYTFDETPSGINRFLGLYFPVFDEQFMQTLAQRIAPGKERELVAKTLNKQTGVIHGVGKAAYVRAKVV